MSSLQKYLEGKIDFEGQKLVERISHYAVMELAIFAFFLGFLFQSIQMTFMVFGVGVGVVLAIIIPPWPMFNQHPVTWLPSKGTREKQQ
ncbi:microsomal signal peptidase subunit [Lactarius sanguifluus]|nr:microsomal signal peptidase subunit [Lactarius sanguifluus]